MLRKWFIEELPLLKIKYFLRFALCECWMTPVPIPGYATVSNLPPLASEIASSTLTMKIDASKKGLEELQRGFSRDRR